MRRTLFYTFYLKKKKKMELNMAYRVVNMFFFQLVMWITEVLVGVCHLDAFLVSSLIGYLLFIMVSYHACVLSR